jgi:glutaredoxin 3
MDALNKLIEENLIVMISKSNCKYCVIAETNLEKFGDIVKIDAIKNPAIYEAAKKLTGQSTVPNIWYNGVHVGGSDKLLAGIENGTIKKPEMKFDEDF